MSNHIVFGWSLGGRIAIELMARSLAIRALALSGAPPIGKLDGVNDMAQRFRRSPLGNIPTKESWSAEDAQSFVERIFGPAGEPFLVEAALRADGRFRKRLMESSREGLGVNQREFIESAALPIAVPNGAQDPVVNLDYFDTLAYRNLCSGVPQRVAGAGHSPFWQEPASFNLLFEQFLSDVA